MRGIIRILPFVITGGAWFVARLCLSFPVMAHTSMILILAAKSTSTARAPAWLPVSTTPKAMTCRCALIALTRAPATKRAWPIVSASVNVYWYKDHLGPDKEDRPEAIAVIDAIIAEIHKVEAPRIVSEDGDYGSIPNFYYDVTFGAWDKPYICTDPDAADTLMVKQEFRRIQRFHEQEARYQAYKQERESHLTLVAGGVQ